MIFWEQLTLLWAPRDAEGCSGWCSKCPDKPSNNESITITTTICIAESMSDAVPACSHPKPVS